jgi:PAS domain S-box-containing protein
MTDKSVKHMQSLREIAEARLEQSRLTQTQDSATNANQNLLHELQVHQIELEMQNEQLRQVQASLEESRDRYVDLYEFAPVGYLTIDSQGFIVQANLKATALLGVERKQLLKHVFSQWVNDEDKDQWYRQFKRVKALESNDELSFDLRLNHKNGAVFYANLNCLRMGGQAEDKMLRVTLMDVSKAKADEQQHRNHELELRRSLVREVHHRIKNSLQGVTGLLRLYSISHPELTDVVTETVSQINSIALTHGLQGENKQSLVMLQALVREIVQSNQQLWQNSLIVEMPLHLSAWQVNEEEAVPLALIMNELVLNAMKHGTPNTPITISLKEPEQSNTALLTITNFGALSQDAQKPNIPNKGTGLSLVDSLLPEEGAELSWQQHENIVSAQLILTTPVISN